MSGHLDRRQTRRPHHRDLRQPPQLRQPLPNPLERRVGGTDRHRDQEPLLPRRTHHVVQQLQGRVVRPMQVLQRHQGAPTPRHPQQLLGDRGQHLTARHGYAVGLAQCGIVTERAKRAAPGMERNVPAGTRQARPHEDLHPPAIGRGREVLQQGRLTDARLTLDDQRRRFARRDADHGRLEDGHRLVPADQTPRTHFTAACPAAREEQLPGCAQHSPLPVGAGPPATGVARRRYRQRRAPCGR